MQFSGWKRSAFFGGLAILLLLSIAVATAPVNAGPHVAQGLPTRPKPTDTPRPSKPSQPDPTATPAPEATATATEMPTNTPVPTATQPPTATPTPTPTPTPTAIAIPGLLPARDLLLPPSGRIEVTFGQLDPGTRTLGAEAPEARYTLDIPGNLSILAAGSTIELTWTHSPRMPNKPATLEVEVNGLPLAAIALTEENASSTGTRVDLPEGSLVAGSNSIVVRLRSGTCEDPGTILTARIDASSLLSLSYEQSRYRTSLSRYPLPFAEKSLLAVPVTILLPDLPTAEGVAAAMTVAAGLGRATEGRIDLQAIPATAFDPDVHGAHHLIAIGRPEAHALFAKLEPKAAVADAILQPGQGLLELVVSPWNEYRLLLVVSRRDDAGIVQAGNVLNQPARLSAMRGSLATISDLPPPSITSGDTLPRRWTLGALGHSQETLYGSRRQRLGYDLTLPYGWQSTGAAVLTLRLSHSNILDPVRSLLDVSLNDRPIGSTFLDESNAGEGAWSLALPERALKAGTNRLEIGIEMSLPGADDTDRCRLLDDRRLWTTIGKNSDLSVPYTIADLAPDLSHFPYPYSQLFGLGQTLFVLPDQPQAALIDDLVRLAAQMGSSTQVGGLSVQAKVASDIDRDSWQDAHLVLLGRATENDLLRDLNAHLPRPFAVGQEADILETVDLDDPALVLDPERDAGVLQTARSPWNQQAALLAVAGTTDRGVHLALQALLKPPSGMEGNLAIIYPVSEGRDQITVYATDTRSAAQTIEDDTPEGPAPQRTLPDPNRVLLAKRWWK